MKRAPSKVGARVEFSYAFAFFGVLSMSFAINVMRRYSAINSTIMNPV